MVSRNLPFEFFVLDCVRFDGVVVAHIGGRPIRDVAVDAGGGRYRFVGLARRDGSGRLDVGALHAGEWIVEPDLIYATDEQLASSSPYARVEKHHRFS